MAENGQSDGQNGEKKKGGTRKGESRGGAGVIPYAEMGYYGPDYEPQDSDI